MYRWSRTDPMPAGWTGRRPSSDGAVMFGQAFVAYALAVMMPGFAVCRLADQAGAPGSVVVLLGWLAGWRLTKALDRALARADVEAKRRRDLRAQFGL